MQIQNIGISSILKSDRNKPIHLKTRMGTKEEFMNTLLKLGPGILVIGYQTSPVKKIVALFEITKELHNTEEEGEVIEFVIKEFLKETVSWSELIDIPELKECEILKSNQGSLFKLSPFEFEVIENLIDERNAPVTEKQAEDYTIQQAIKESGLEEKVFNRYLAQLKRKKQVIFQGPPGTGKSYLADIFMKFLTKKNPGQYEVIQFHPSYSYEDFVQVTNFHLLVTVLN